MKITRREFVHRFSSCVGCFVATATFSALPTHSTAQIRRSITPGESPRFTFPQGIASADPHPDAVVLWTRVQDAQSSEPVELVTQIARDQAFIDIVLESSVSSAPQLDQTLRLFAQGLEPSNWYWYRFVTPDGYASPVGRTCTAPHPEAEERDRGHPLTEPERGREPDVDAEPEVDVAGGSAGRRSRDRTSGRSGTAR